MKDGEFIRSGTNVDVFPNKNKGYKIAVTGGIGSGKSTVCDLIANKGFPVYSCDSIYAELLQDAGFCTALEVLFPGTISSGKVDRRALRKVLSNENDVERLNAFTHPAIMRSLFEKNEQAFSAGERYVFSEVPLLFEGGYQKYFDAVVVVLRDAEKRIESVVSRDCCAKEDALQKMRLQFNYADRDKKSYPASEKIYFLENNKGLTALKNAVDSMLDCISGETK